MSFGVSIVLYRHSPNNLEALLHSLNLAQSVQRIWLVDNGGCDWGENWCVYSKFRYIRSPKNGGFGYGHNKAIGELSTDLSHHIICNPDIMVSPSDLDYLDVLVNRCEEHVVMPNILYPNGERQELCKLLPNPLNLFVRRFLPRLADRLDHRYLLRGADFSKRFFAPSLSGCFMVCRVSALLSQKGFDERFFMYMEDLDLSRRLALQGGALFMPEVSVVHAFEKGSYKSGILLRYHIKSAIQYFNKWGWFFDMDRRILNERCLRAVPWSSAL